MTAPARTPEQRKQDSLHRLKHDVDAWVATADGGTPYMIPLSFLWDSGTLVISTPASSPTSRNLIATGKVRVGVGPTRDLVLIEGTATAMSEAEVTSALGDGFAAKAGFDPRELETPYQYLRLRPVRLLAWREANELEGRELMRSGEWLVAG